MKESVKNHSLMKEKKNDIIMDNKLDIKLLDDTINDLKNNKEACTTYGGGTFDEISIPESKPGEQLTKFIQYFYDNNLLDQNYRENFEKIGNKKIEEFTYQEVLTGLTKIIRSDRFVSGELYNCVKNGSMLNLIERLYYLVKLNHK